ncbi:very long chain fatty acid elongase 2-like [Periplaneta americana]|uniref:very long chain fatty acid elongase 2-like n=1 Tax=Periplaneta americana TaxID=6978 RepID=UPI0037E9675E
MLNDKNVEETMDVSEELGFLTYYQESLLGQPVSDWRVRKWLFLSSPYPFLWILVCYFSFLYFGRQFMKSRPAFSLKKVLLTYNVTQILLSCYVFKEVLITAYLSGYNLICQPIDRSLDPLPLRMAEAFWWFLASKVFDLLDTVFFVLRKKESQLTFLHIYHHSTMLPNWYLGILYLPGGQAFLSVLLNSLVHVIMYSYYMLSALGPALQPYLWWKKYLTQLQLTQFLVVSAHILVGMYHSCDPPNWLTTWTLSYMCTMVALFLNFYFKAYLRPLPSKTSTNCFPAYYRDPKEELTHLYAVYEKRGHVEGGKSWKGCWRR